MKSSFKFLFVFIIFSCSKIHNYDTVEYVDINKFMGEWYVIASVPTFIEKNAVNPIETYSLNKDGYIDTDFSFYIDKSKNKMKQYHFKAFIRNVDSNAEWGMQFFWPLRVSYLIVDLADDYSYTVVSVPSKKYIWIMSKNDTISNGQYQEILDRLHKRGYDISKIIKTIQI